MHEVAKADALQGAGDTEVDLENARVSLCDCREITIQASYIPRGVSTGYTQYSVAFDNEVLSCIEEDISSTRLYMIQSCQ